MRLKIASAIARHKCHIDFRRGRAGRPDADDAAEPLLREIIDALPQVMCAHDAEKVAIYTLEIYDDGNKDERTSK